MPIQVFQLTETVCDVCRLCDGDTSLKYCFHCGLCDAWICRDDADKWLRRAKAAFKHKLEPNYKGDPNYRTGNDEIDKSEGLSA